MQSKEPNKSIGCSVEQCKYHCNADNYCSLKSIMVGTHEPNPTVSECVDCESFEVK